MIPGLIEKIHAQTVDDITGTVSLPPTFKYGGVETGLMSMFNNVLRLVFVVAGIYAFINLIIAGFQYMSAGGDAKALGHAWSRIWQSLLGLAIVVGSFALAALMGAIFFGDPTIIFKPHIYGPGE